MELNEEDNPYPVPPVYGDTAKPRTMIRGWQRYRAIGGSGGRGDKRNCHRMLIQRKIISRTIEATRVPETKYEKNTYVRSVVR